MKDLNLRLFRPKRNALPNCANARCNYYTPTHASCQKVPNIAIHIYGPVTFPQWEQKRDTKT